uniref:Acetyl-CoA carboxylase central domain-containing protein n=1 Tax=Magallana gigas TaxID=29159 RepID=A0A8W8JG91_MAGGI
MLESAPSSVPCLQMSSDITYKIGSSRLAEDPFFMARFWTVAVWSLTLTLTTQAGYSKPRALPGPYHSPRPHPHTGEAPPTVPEYPGRAREYLGGVFTARALLQTQATGVHREADEVFEGPCSPTARTTSFLFDSVQDLVAMISGRILPQVEKAIKKEMHSYASNITSVLSQFPSQQIANVIDSHAATLTRRTERENFFMTTQGIVQLVQRYRNGIRGHMKSVVQELLKQYVRVEVQFQHGHYDKCIAQLISKTKDMSAVAGSIFSHLAVQNKNLLVTMLIVLIAAHTPPYELINAPDGVHFLSAIDMYGPEFNPEIYRLSKFSSFFPSVLPLISVPGDRGQRTALTLTS